MSNALHSISSPEPAWLERRQAERVEAKLKVTFRELRNEDADSAVHAMEESNVLLLAYQARAKHPSDIMEAQTRDISVSGIRLGGEMQLLAGRTLSPGIFLELDITDPETQFSVRAIAMVAWSRQGQDKTFEAGLSIFTIDEGDLQQLQRLVEKNRKNQGN